MKMQTILFELVGGRHRTCASLPSGSATRYSAWMGEWGPHKSEAFHAPNQDKWPQESRPLSTGTLSVAAGPPPWSHLFRSGWILPSLLPLPALTLPQHTSVSGQMWPLLLLCSLWTQTLLPLSPGPEWKLALSLSGWLRARARAHLGRR